MAAWPAEADRPAGWYRLLYMSYVCRPPACSCAPKNSQKRTHNCTTVADGGYTLHWPPQTQHLWIELTALILIRSNNNQNAFSDRCSLSGHSFSKRVWQIVSQNNIVLEGLKVRQNAFHPPVAWSSLSPPFIRSSFEPFTRLWSISHFQTRC